MALLMGPTPAEEYERRWRWRPRKSWTIVDGEAVAETVALGAEAEGGVHLMMMMLMTMVVKMMMMMMLLPDRTSRRDFHQAKLSQILPGSPSLKPACNHFRKPPSP